MQNGTSWKIMLVDDEELLLDSLEIILSLHHMQITGKAHDGREALELMKTCPCELALVDLNMKGMGGIELISHLKRDYPQTKILVLTTFYDDENITRAISGGADGYLLKDSGKDAVLGAINQIMGGRNVIEAKVMNRLAALMLQRNGGNTTDGVPVGAVDRSNANDGVPVGAVGRGNANDGAFVGAVDRSNANDGVPVGAVGRGNANDGAFAGAVGRGNANDGFTGVAGAGSNEPLRESHLTLELTQREKEICSLLSEGLNNKQIAEALYISEGTVKNYISGIYDKTGIHDRAKLIVELRREV